jgi:SSS family solute:Na+ symporter
MSSLGFSKANAQGVYEIPYLDRMGFVFILCIVGMVIITNVENRKGVQPSGLDVDPSMFRMHTSFIVGSVLVCGILVALYTMFW